MCLSMKYICSIFQRLQVIDNKTKVLLLEVVLKVCCYRLKKNYNLNLLEVAGVQELVEVEEDLLVDHLLELEILEGRPE